MMHIPRPHLTASSQRKYAYSVTVHSLTLSKALPSAKGISILWTRGSKTAMTTERSFLSNQTYEEDLSLICTLFTDGAQPPRFAEKLCTFAAVESRTVGKLSGVRTVGKCKLDISKYADVSVGQPRPLELRLSRNNLEVGKLTISISCRWLRESFGGTEGGGGAPSDASANGSPPPFLSRAGGPRGASSMGESFRFSEFSEQSEDDYSDVSSEMSDASSPQQRLAELDEFPFTTTQMIGEEAETPSPAAPAAASSPAAASMGGVGMVRVSRGSAGEPATTRHFAPLPDAPAPSTTTTAAAATDIADTTTPPRSSLTASPPAANATSSGGGGSSSAKRRAHTTFAPTTPTMTPGLDRACSNDSVGSSGGMGTPGGDGLRGSGSSGGGGGSGRRAMTVMAAPGLEASERSRVEAERRQLEAQASASLQLHKKVLARLEQERAEWQKEKEGFAAELAAGREALLEAQTEARHKETELRKRLAERDEARAEASRLKAEREELMVRLEGGSGADAEDKLAVEQDLQGKLEQSENHLVEVSRKMTKAHKRQENLLGQYEAEMELLSEKVDQLEDECCEAEQARLAAEHSLSESEATAKRLKAEIDRQERRAAIQPAGAQELSDQLEMANTVKELLVSEMAVRTDELAVLKVEYAQVQAEREEGVLKLKKSDDKCRRLRLHMTRLEVQLADYDNSRADEEEEKAVVFRDLMQAQETKIRELEARIEAGGGTPRKKWPFG